MAANIEIKAQVTDLERVRALAERLDVRERLRLVQKDTFFHAPLGRLKLREFEDGSAELIGYDRPDDAGPKRSRYERAAVADAGALAAALSMTLGVRGVVEKLRDVLLVGPTRIHLDQVTGLGSFVELEVVMQSGQDPAEGEATARRLLDALEIADDALISSAYIDLLDGGPA